MLMLGAATRLAELDRRADGALIEQYARQAGAVLTRLARPTTPTAQAALRAEGGPGFATLTATPEDTSD